MLEVIITSFIIIPIIIILVFKFLIVCPPKNFFKDMPKEVLKKGTFIPYSFILNRFEKDEIKYFSNKTYSRLIFAYIHARIEACKLDYDTINKSRYLAIGWGIKSKEELGGSECVCII